MPKTSISWKSILIYLKSQIKFWNLKSFILSSNLFQTSQNLFPIWTLHCGAMGVCSSLSCDKVILNEKKIGFRLNFKISKLDSRFQINSNGFSKHRSFGHYTKYLLTELTEPSPQIWGRTCRQRTHANLIMWLSKWLLLTFFIHIYNLRAWF